MIRSMIDLGKKMGLRIIAEGIEDDWQFAALVDMGADEVQLFLFGVPSMNPMAEYGPDLRERRTFRNGGFQAFFETA